MRTDNDRRPTFDNYVSARAHARVTGSVGCTYDGTEYQRKDDDHDDCPIDGDPTGSAGADQDNDAHAHDQASELNPPCRAWSRPSTRGGRWPWQHGREDA